MIQRKKIRTLKNASMARKYFTSSFSPSVSPSVSLSSSTSTSVSPSDHDYLEPSLENIRLSLSVNKTDKNYELELKSNINISIEDILNSNDEYKELINTYLDVAKQRISNEINTNLIYRYEKL